MQNLVPTAYLLCVLSVPIPFCGDYIGLQGNPKLQKLKGRAEEPILVAENVKKINRGNGKVKACMPNSSPQLGLDLGPMGGRRTGLCVLCWVEWTGG